jgi:hypothetical protein
MVMRITRPSRGVSAVDVLAKSSVTIDAVLARSVQAASASAATSGAICIGRTRFFPRFVDCMYRVTHLACPFMRPFASSFTFLADGGAASQLRPLNRAERQSPP